MAKSENQAKYTNADSTARGLNVEQNLNSLVGPGPGLRRTAAAVASGLMISLAFPPWELDAMIWVALLPLLLATPSPRTRHRALTGWLFGFSLFATSLYWLNEVGFCAGFLLAVVCAFFPMCWYLASCSLIESLILKEETGKKTRGSYSAFGGRLTELRKTGHQCLAVIALPTLWVALEWIRSWIFTGFPWNQLGISQWNRPSLLALTTVTGVYGISFLVMVLNTALAFALHGWWTHFRKKRPYRPSVPIVLAAAIFISIPAVNMTMPEFDEPDGYATVAAVQGNIPQCRVWTLQQLDEAIEVYISLSREMVSAASPDLIVWPETAVPATITLPEYRKAINSLIEETQTPLLLGAIDFRDRYFPTENNTASSPNTTNHFNAAFLIGTEGKIQDHYDKIHLVPFGEFTPMEKLFPWLNELIGMGRGLTAGTEYTVMQPAAGMRAGVNICFEDVFPEISREFVLRNANVLFTLTNDAWYAESSGSKQHLLHAIFRAVENRRPLMRSGNNSDTCLILPDGTLQGMIYDHTTGSPFVRGAHVYRIPIWDSPELTFYSKYGNVFARACAVAAAMFLVIPAAVYFKKKKKLFETITSDADE